ncbi:MAG TPA: alpha-amylase family glycosyl hydrolase [Myxococcota bacterium]|nr:alpha-amylase family glycosyl hydrolase [Myxococcota bacterium]HRY93249.1 alpha-amylase family glycosyl hydrolase [Myxococcota bacterium]HSA20695.1 alpha-amylase family glycosyl hydrolase [Myxococcota bacterium]
MKPRMLWALALLPALSGCVTPPDLDGPLSDNVTDWRDEIIYQVMTDRFANGDASNDFGVNLADPSDYHGGDWRGLQDRLGYLEQLGVTCLWISPVVKNVEEDAGFSSYHGYWAQDLDRPNPHFGDLSALRELVDAAHARGMKVVLDIVTNHVGQAFFYDINKNGQPDEFLMGQGGEIVPIGQGEPSSDLVRVTEWDPDFDRDGVQSWTSLGPSGLAPAVFVHQPEINRVPPEPWPLGEAWAYNQKGRVTVWQDPEVCGCPAWGCAWDDACRREQEVLGDFPGGLKDLDTRHPYVRATLADSFARWIARADFDGFRIDTLKHVELGFWDDFCPRMRRFALERGKRNFFMFGEAFDGDDNLLGSYTQGQGVDSVFYFSQYYTVFRGALLGDGARTCEIERLHCRRLGCASDPCGEGQAFPALYSDTPKENGVTGEDGLGLGPARLPVSFESNHDVGRLLFFMPPAWTEPEKRAVLHQALAYLLTVDGVPALYYGVEQEFSGGNDPANRETLWDADAYLRPVWKDGHWKAARRTYDGDGDGEDDTLWEPFDTGNPTFHRIAELIALRKAHVALRRGELVFRWSTAGSGGEDHGLVAYERVHPDERALVALNLGKELPSVTRAGGQTMPVGFAPGAVLEDALDPAFTVSVAASGCAAPSGGGCLELELPARGVRILLAR